MMSQPIKWLEDGALPKERLCNIQYSDLIGDTMGAVQQIYDFFEIELTDEGRTAMEEHLEQDRRSDRPAHQYDLGSEDEIQMEREAFRQYQEYFGVANEI